MTAKDLRETLSNVSDDTKILVRKDNIKYNALTIAYGKSEKVFIIGL